MIGSIESLAKMGVYRELRRCARKVVDEGGYNLSTGEMNPMIWRWFGLTLRPRQRVWEPFANPDGRNFKLADELALDLVSTSLMEGHSRIVVADSTTDEPEGMFDGVLFHPPYFGSSSFTNDPRDLSNVAGELDWKAGIKCAIDNILNHLNPDGQVCAVGRRYRHGGKEIKLDEWYVEMFGSQLKLIDVWESIPDIVMIFRKEV